MTRPHATIMLGTGRWSQMYHIKDVGSNYYDRPTPSWRPVKLKSNISGKSSLGEVILAFFRNIRTMALPQGCKVSGGLWVNLPRTFPGLGRYSQKIPLQLYCTSGQLISNPSPFQRFLHFQYCSGPFHTKKCIRELLSWRCVLTRTTASKAKRR